jgi:hypothetical protein
MTYPPPPPHKKRRHRLLVALPTSAIAVVVLCCTGAGTVVWYQAYHQPAQQNSDTAAIVTSIGAPQGFAVSQPYHGHGTQAVYTLACKAGKCPIDPIEKLIQWTGHAGPQTPSREDLTATFANQDWYHVYGQTNSYHLRLDLYRGHDDTQADTTSVLYTAQVYTSPTNSL